MPMEAAPLRRRLTAEEGRAGILQAALAVFSERGFPATAIDDVAREAGISKALIHEHLGSKQELYANPLEHNAQQLSERLGSALEHLETDSGADRVTAQDRGARAIEAERAEQERAIRMLAQMLVGAVQSLANWWAGHQEVPRAQLVEMVMDFAWLGLERLSGGERWPRAR